jgi:hypothetical protein
MERGEIRRSFKAEILFTILLLFLFFFLPAILFAHDNVQVHPYIVEQAFYVWPSDNSSEASHEIKQYMGFGYRDWLGSDLLMLTYPKACANAGDGNKITEGAKEEDDYDPILGSCTFFCTKLAASRRLLSSFL